MRLLSKYAWDIIVKDDFLYFQMPVKLNKNKQAIYRFGKSDLDKSWEISEPEFNVIKYGNNYEKFLPLVGSNCDYVVHLPDGSLVCTGFRDYIFYFIDSYGNIKSKRSDIGFNNIYSFDIEQNGFLWFAIPTANYIGQFSLDLGKEVYHFGTQYDWNGPLNLPEDIKIYDKYAYISNMGANSIIRLNINSKKWSKYLQFNQPTWEYRQCRKKEIIRLQDGVYVLD